MTSTKTIENLQSEYTRCEYEMVLAAARQREVIEKADAEIAEARSIIEDCVGVGAEWHNAVSTIDDAVFSINEVVEAYTQAEEDFSQACYKLTFALNNVATI